MDFVYEGHFWVDEVDLEDMVKLCRKHNLTPQVALSEVASGWDDCDFYAVGQVEDQIITEIERRLK